MEIGATSPSLKARHSVAWAIAMGLFIGYGLGNMAFAQSKPVIPPPALVKDGPKPAPSISYEKKKTIIGVLKKQQDDWNRGDLAGFMEGYWRSDTLRMVSSRGVTYGWDKIFANYKKSYADSVAMGKLNFEIIHVELIGESDAMVTGKWLLKIDKKFKGGFFTLLFRKLKGKWLIVADHTS